MKIPTRFGLQAKLILLFVIIKVVPLALLGWLAWTQSYKLADNLTHEAEKLVGIAKTSVQTVGNSAIADASKALDDRAREEIERQTTDTASDIATFLYGRDTDIRSAASLEPNEQTYKNFLRTHMQDRIVHGQWKLTDSQKSWEPVEKPQHDATAIEPGSSDNAKEFHYRAPDQFKIEASPLYLEISFIGLDGKEKIKATSSDLVSHELKDVSQKQNTFIKAETYFPEIKKLKPNEIYVSDVIGAYVDSKVIGTYTPAAAQKAGIPYAPQNSAYAGKENPVGKRFKGIVRWVTPVTKNGNIVGWVSLALDHDHIMEFTDTIVPTTERYSDISDASAGNYAFVWDYKGRNIVHPRHYSITGYDPNTGDPAVPWLEKQVYSDWQKSGLDFKKFIESAPTFHEQTNQKKPSPELTKSGNLGLDCRYLNFAPQCIGWYNLTKYGGSGSFYIQWSGIWKLTTAAAIPYYTGQYGQSKRGFGIVTIGANVDDFHRAANESKGRLDKVIANAENEMLEQGKKAYQAVDDSMKTSAYGLILSTTAMIIVVILIAIWIASYLSNRIKWLVSGIGRFRAGERHFRFNAPGQDEIQQLSSSFDEMANTLDSNLTHLEEEISARAQKETELNEIKNNLEVIVEERTQELSKINLILRDEVETRRVAEEQARHFAGHDALTGLCNRFMFNELLLNASGETLRKRQHAALLFFDLDKFKQINDTMGHAFGDKLLKYVADVLTKRARRSDTVARLGGDEFAIIMTELPEPLDASILAQTVIDQLSMPIFIDGQEINIGISIGITIFSGTEHDPEQLLTQADMAMYEAKTEGGNKYRFFEQSMQNTIVARKQLEKELRTALHEHQFLVYYQPRHDCANNAIPSMEALVRWKHPERGILAPGEFIETAIRSGLMPLIDDEVFKIACSQVKAWMDEGVYQGRIAINILPNAVSYPGFDKLIFGMLNKTKLPPDKLELEITERSILESSSVAIQNLTTLRQSGICISIDDFGIEHSSLQRLVECPIDILKIDRFFVNLIGTEKAEAIIAAIIAMSKSINLEIVAEGVETVEQLEYLQKLNCNIVQGYLKARPMPAEATRRHLLENKAAAEHPAEIE